MNYKKGIQSVIMISLLFIFACSGESENENGTTDKDTSSAVTDIKDDTGDMDNETYDIPGDTGVSSGHPDVKEPMVGEVDGSDKELKIGYVNSIEILYKLPDVRTADQKIQQYAQQLDQYYQQEAQRFQNKYMKYMQDTSTVSETVLKSRAEEMQRMQDNLMKLKSQSEQEIQTKREELYKPIEEKVNRAIKQVAQQNGYTHILDVSSILYIESGLDLTPKVKSALGIQ